MEETGVFPECEVHIYEGEDTAGSESDGGESDCEFAKRKKTKRSNNVCAKPKRKIGPKIRKFKNASYVYRDFTCTKFFHNVQDFERLNVSKNFVCGYCDKMFETRTKLFSHMNEHVTPAAAPVAADEPERDDGTSQRHESANERGVKKYSCSTCKKSFTRRSGLRIHIRDAHEKPQLFSCSECSNTFPGFKQLKSHFVNVHTQCKKFSCNLCPRVFAVPSELQQHMANHNGGNEKPFKCSRCSKGFTNKQNLMRHCRLHEEVLPCKCEYCQKSYATKREVCAHMRSAHFRCDRCHQKFECKNDLSQHVVTHGSELKCNLCDRKFENHSDLSLHAGEHVKDDLYYCNTCDKKFTTSTILRTHYRSIHKGERGFLCKECGKRFFNGSYYKIHLRSHSGEKPFLCEICCKSFADAGRLAAHSKTHSVIKTFKCDQCDMSFYRKPNLTSHYRKHTGEKPFLCNVCGRSFRHKNGLKMHNRIHTGERPYSCGQCSKTFRNSGDLHAHERSHRSPENQCHYCTARYSKLISLKRHVKESHPESAAPQTNQFKAPEPQLDQLRVSDEFKYRLPETVPLDQFKARTMPEYTVGSLGWLAQGIYEASFVAK